MAVPDIILNKGEILLQQTNGQLGIELDNSSFLNATVVAVNDLTDSFEVGQFVLFSPKDELIIKYDNTDYHLVPETSIKYREEVAL